MFNSVSKIACGFLLLIFSITALGNAPQIAEITSSGSEPRWQKSIIPISISKSFLKPNPAIKKDSEITVALERSLKTWEAVANIEFQVFWTEKQSVSPSGKNGDGLSLITVAQTAENLLVFSGEASEVTARTRVFFNRRGLINEADIVLNPYLQFSTDGTFGTFDLEATLTHEIGHLLGLEHSSVFGATMNETQGKNGVYNLSNFAPRTLAEDDIAAVRAIYGAKNAEDKCCGIVAGKILLPNGKAAKNIFIWAEESETGRIFAGTKTNSEGEFQINGLPDGKFEVFGQGGIKTSGENFVADQLGEIEVIQDKSVRLDTKFENYYEQLDVTFIGFNGQLSRFAVPINAGKSYSIYFGGKSLETKDLSIITNSPFLKADSTNFKKYDYGTNLSVWSFELNVGEEISDGEYSLLFQNGLGQKTYLVGELTAEQFSNPWIIYNLK